MADTEKPAIGLLLMAYGSPDNLDDIPAYLLDIRGGRETPPALVEEIRARYRAIGGRSPLLELTRKQAAGLEAALSRRYPTNNLQFQAYVGMRHWQPRIQEAVRQMADDGIRTIAALVMAPHASRMSTGAYFSRLDESISHLDTAIQVMKIENWHADPGFIEAIAEKTSKATGSFGGADPYVIFTAHSLPVRIIDQGDPYDDQLHETASLVAEHVGLRPERWSFSYQSAGQSREPWLGPQIETVVRDLAAKGEKNLLVAPIGFVCDHVEVLYDIDIHCKEIAAGLGARLERQESLNDSPAFITALANLVSQCLEQQGFI
jgi:ferrochelatase